MKAIDFVSLIFSIVSLLALAVPIQYNFVTSTRRPRGYTQVDLADPKNHAPDHKVILTHGTPLLFDTTVAFVRASNNG